MKAIIFDLFETLITEWGKKRRHDPFASVVVYKAFCKRLRFGWCVSNFYRCE